MVGYHDDVVGVLGIGEGEAKKPAGAAARAERAPAFTPRDLVKSLLSMLFIVPSPRWKLLVEAVERCGIYCRSTVQSHSKHVVLPG